VEVYSAAAAIGSQIASKKKCNRGYILPLTNSIVKYNLLVHWDRFVNPQKGDQRGELRVPKSLFSIRWIRAGTILR
jgi:hypothetical protein